MKNAKRFIPESMKCLTFLLLVGLIFTGCTEKEEELIIENANVETLTDIEGEYSCTGECIKTSNGNRTISHVEGETDNIQRYPGAKKGLYQVDITAPGFHELELGVLSGRTLRTATAEVSDSTYPVLEEYVFHTDDAGKVVGFTKTASNPDHDNFKMCVVYGTKVNK